MNLFGNLFGNKEEKRKEEANRIFFSAAAEYQNANYGRSIQLFTQCLNMGPSTPSITFYERGKAYEARGDMAHSIIDKTVEYRSALEDYERAREAFRHDGGYKGVDLNTLVRKRIEEIKAKM